MASCLRLCSVTFLLVTLLQNLGLAQNAQQKSFPTTQPNFLVVAIDDVGTDKIGAYAEHPQPAPTPVIDSLAANGILFRNAYANPLCSPTRALMLTGRHGFRTGIGQAILSGATHALATDELTIPKALNRQTPGLYELAAVGKWHLGLLDDATSPNDHGFDFFSGPLANLNAESYFTWTKTVNGIQFVRNAYATTDQVNDAINRIEIMPEPWFLWLAFNAAHDPWHAPPSHLHSFSLSGNPDDSISDHYDAAIEAVDTELGRMLSSIDPEVLANTMIFFIGDNGTPLLATTSPTGKGSVYEGGVNVPFIVAGPLVEQPGRECQHLVHAQDLYQTVLDLAGEGQRRSTFPNKVTDSVSFAPYLTDPSAPELRQYVYSERFEPNGFGPYVKYWRMVRDARWKLIEFETPPCPDEFYDMQDVHFEGINLLEHPMTPELMMIYQRLKTAMLDIRTDA